MKQKLDIRSMPLPELEEYFVAKGEKKFRAKQVYQWLHQKLIRTPDEMNNIPKSIRADIEENTEWTALREITCYTSKIDGTAKFLFELRDHHIIESVLMKYKHGNSVCISSQVGCRMGCKFCASTLDGLERNLRPSEMLDQIYYIQKKTGERVTNVVVMGSGEPFDNYENLLVFLRMLTDSNGLNISQRNITVSTCGLVPFIRKLADERLQITLAISLHAPNDEIRKRMMPIANRYSMDEILDACKYYIEKTGRRITFEYCLAQGQNDSIDNARELVHRIKGMLCHVNLIPVNPVKERAFLKSKQQSILDFKNLLEKNKINVTIRREMGGDIQAACGQLRKKYYDERREEEYEILRENSCGNAKVD